ncbi:uncharacterized protein LOC130717370 [Lotus japonicus]|uniref:uncharacterized protein LOC130717370 n=1 Tax=Lotus japonicus TaxID=34305 RepID=UPI002590CBCF|nr:uncharacterized protein LOC130717370 [Lotus japonicus]
MKIVQIPLTSYQRNDIVIWKDNRDGQYSVKSGYKQLRCIQNIQQTTGPSHSNGSKLWQQIWAMKSLPRCKELIWRASKEILPVKMNMKKRGMNIDPICPCCGEEEETTIHALLTCEPVRRIWFASHLNIHISMDTPDNFLCWLERILAHPEKDTMAEVFNMIWAIWGRRNAWTFEQQLWDINRTLAKATSISVREAPRPAATKNTTPPKWKAPPRGFYKLNVDAAIRRNLGTGLGAIIRNEKGESMAAATWLIEEIEDPSLVEAAGIKWALRWTKEMGFDRVLVETDSVLFVNQWERSQTGISYFADIVKECKHLSYAFSLCTVSHVKRDCNVVADFLANLAFDFHENYWLEEDPPGTSLLISADVTHAASVALE